MDTFIFSQKSKGTVCHYHSYDQLKHNKMYKIKQNGARKKNQTCKVIRYDLHMSILKVASYRISELFTSRALPFGLKGTKIYTSLKQSCNTRNVRSCENVGLVNCLYQNRSSNTIVISKKHHNSCTNIYFNHE